MSFSQVKDTSLTKSIVNDLEELPGLNGSYDLTLFRFRVTYG